MLFLTLVVPNFGGESPLWGGRREVLSTELVRFTLLPDRHIFDLSGGVWATRHF